MKKILFMTLLCGIIISNNVNADVNFSGLPEYQVEQAKKDQIFNDNYLDTENKKEYREKEKRIEEFYDFFHKNFDLTIDNWKKLSDVEKITKLLDFLTNLSEKNKEKLNNMNFLTDEATKYFYVEKYQDEFMENVANLEGKTEELKVTTDKGKEIPLTRTTWIDENGRKYTKDIYHYDSGDLIELKENNQAFYDYYDITSYDGVYYVFSRGFSTDGNPQKTGASIGASLPEGYTVAKDRSDHLSNEEKGRLIVIPKDTSLLPDGVEIIDDGRGGKIVKAQKSAYKPNGNLALKADPTLQRTISIRSSKTIEHNYFNSTTAIDEFMTQEGNISTTYGRDRSLSDMNDIYYTNSRIDIDNNKTNFQTENGVWTDYQGPDFDKSSYSYDAEQDIYIPTNDFINKINSKQK